MTTSQYSRTHCRALTAERAEILARLSPAERLLYANVTAEMTVEGRLDVEIAMEGFRGERVSVGKVTRKSHE